MVELELLAAKWGMKKCHIFLAGLPHFQLVVDHLPLVSILDKQTLDCVENARLQRLKMGTSPYSFSTVWKKGKDHRIPDALSRAPVQDPSLEDLEEEKELYNYVCSLQRTTAIAIERETENLDDDSLADPLLAEIQNAGNNDREYSMIMKYLQNEDTASPSELSHLSKILPELSVANSLILYRQRLFIPTHLRREILRRLHASHQGVDRTTRRARQTVYWPGLASDIKSTVEACDECQKRLPSQAKEPLKRDQPPERPFEEMAADFFSIGNNHFLALIDRFSSWVEVVQFSHPPTAAFTIRSLRQIFCAVGCPTRLFTDGGLPFTAQDTQDFLVHWGVRHRLSTPEYPQSNGLAESAVKMLKGLLLKTGGAVNETFMEGLMEMRNTPRPGGKSPAEIVYGRPLRSRVPAHHRAFDPKWLVSMEEHDMKMSKLLTKTTDDYNASSRALPYIPIGYHVRIQNQQTKLWDRVGIVVSIGKSRDYRVKLPSGRCLWRNRRLLRPITDLKSDTPKTTKDPPKEPPAPQLRRSKRQRKRPKKF